MRLLRGIALLLVVLAGGVALVCWFTLPPSFSTLNIAGLSAPVDITLDSHGIPRIKAASEADAAMALGYLHARDRMFQMELMRRSASGRLAELAGPRALKLDRMSRTLGEELHAEKSYQNLPNDTRALLVAYAAGVNAWIAQRGRFAAPEFLLLGTPEPWRPVDCLLWSETVALWLSGNFDTELADLSLSKSLTPEKIRQLWPPQPGTPAPDSTRLPARQGFLGDFLKNLPRFPDPFTLPGEASNEWAVDGTTTLSGAPLLAGDPHLALQFPAIWYLARIETPTNSLVGATAPGVPFLIIGRNAHIAWTFTTAGTDTQDLFIETPLPGGMYATPTGPQPFQTRVEHIHVRGAPDELLTVRNTRHGPVISDLLDQKGGPVLALEAAQYELDSGAPGILALDRANTVEEAGQAAAKILSPVQNLAVADISGIALFTTGEVPLRGSCFSSQAPPPQLAPPPGLTLPPQPPPPPACSGGSTFPVPGADGLHDWHGFASGTALPVFEKPVSGILVNANERTAPPDFPTFLGADWHAPWRARRIHQLLGEKKGHTVADFAAMQADDVSVFARDMLPAFAALPRQVGAAWQAQSLLAKWDGTMSEALPQPVIFNATIQLFVKQVLAANHVPERDAGPWAGFAAWLLTPEGGSWCGGDCRPALSAALRLAMQDGAKKYGADLAKWRWGTVHRAIFSHPLLGDLPVIGRFASRQISVPGDDTTLFRGGNGVLGEFAARHGAAYRGVYDLKNLENSRFIVTPGQSGNFFSANAWDMMPLWAAGTPIAIPPTPDSIFGRIRLNP